MRSRVLVVSGDPVGSAMAGPAIRAVELARVLVAGGHDVVLAAPALDPDAVPAGVRGTTAAGSGELRSLAVGVDVVVAFAPVVAAHPWLGELDATLVVDAYDPGLLETLERRRGEPVNAQRDWAGAAQRQLVEPLRHADVVLVASERQRHFVVGALAALGRLTPRVVAEDPGLDRLVRVVPFGTPDGPPPPATARPLTGPGGLVDPTARVALWGGGLYDWLDPLTLVEAVARARSDALVAVFLAGRHPTPAVGHAPLVDRVLGRAADLGLLGGRVVVHEEWVPYTERTDWLADAAVGVSLHHRHIETEFAFRTRILDYLWAGLPVVCSRGDHWAEVVAARGLGVAVPPGDAAGVAEALDRLVDEPPGERDERTGRARIVATEHAWSTVAAPLLEVCADPGRAPDRRVGDDPTGVLGGVAEAARRVTRAARRRW